MSSSRTPPLGATSRARPSRSRNGPESLPEAGYPGLHAWDANARVDRDRSEDSAASTPGRIRTCDRRFRKPLLYPPELRAHENRHSASHRLDTERERPDRKELRPAGFEPATCGLGNRRSILLSYEREVLSPEELSGIVGFPVNSLASGYSDLRHFQSPTDRVERRRVLP